MAWTLANLRSKLRDLVGRHTTGELSDANALIYLNNYLQLKFPMQAQLYRFESSYTQAMTATDSGEYALSEDVLDLEEPVFANDDPLRVFEDKREFWEIFASEEEYTTHPGLAIGTSSKAAVANDAFIYNGQDGYTRNKAATETALSGDAVPQSKYGAWLFEIDDDGTIAVQEAGDNATGYATAALAVAGLPAASSGTIIMGYVTAINTSGAFTPGTTELDAAGVTDTYTDGDPGLRGQPQAILVNRSAGKLYVRPKCDDSYLLKSNATMQRPTALSDDSDTLSDEAWGKAVVLGAAIDFLSDKEAENDRLAELDFGGLPYSMSNPRPGSLQHELILIRTKESRQVSGRCIPAHF